MAYGNYTFTTNLYAVTNNVASFLQISREGVVKILNSDSTATAEQLYVDIVNRLHADLYNGMAMTGVVETTGTITASDNTIAIPASLFRLNLIDAEFVSSTDQWVNKVKLAYMTREQKSQLPAPFLDEDYNTGVPAYYCFNEDNTELEFWPYPDQTYQVRLWFREAPSSFVTSDISNAASTKYIALPNEFADVLALAIAKYLCIYRGDTERMSALQVLYDERKTKLDTDLSDVAGTLDREQYTFSTYPPTGQQSNPFAGRLQRRYW